MKWNDKITVFNEDCMETMARYPDNYFDLAIVDPPYGIGEARGQWKSRSNNRIDKRNGKSIIVKHRGYKEKDWDLAIPSGEYFAEINRVSRNQIIWGGNYFTDFLSPSSGWVVWDKVNGDNDFSDCELAWTSFNKGVRQLEFKWAGFIQASSIKNGKIAQGNKSLCEKRIHPTQKPKKLYAWLITNYSKPGQKILDTHLGSGSHAITAHYHKNCGEFVGAELDKDYYQDSLKRFKRETAQLTIF